MELVTLGEPVKPERSPPDLVCFGEAMLEVTGALGGLGRLGFGGDTLNTALYLARLGQRVQFASALGADPYSADLRAVWANEGVGLDLLLTHPSRLPGLYAIRTDASGERSFHYWRSQSAAREFFALTDAEAALHRMAQAKLLYLSGITLSIFDGAERERIMALAAQVRANGGAVAFDPNFRLRGWGSIAEARAVISSLAAHVSVALPTVEDETSLWGGDEADSLDRWQGWGAAEVVVKCGPRGALLCTASGAVRVPVPREIVPVDTTGAGDSFNAAYLSARLSGQGPEEAARAGHRLAGTVIGYPGAIIPHEAMPSVLVPA